MLKQTIKRMALTGATVMVLMSTAAAPAMAAPAGYQEDLAGYQEDLAVSQDQQQHSSHALLWVCIYRPELCVPPPPTKTIY